MTHNSKHFRRSHVLLIADLVFLEIFLVFIYVLFRVIIQVFNSNISINLSQPAFDIFSIFFFIFISVFELILILFVVLKWASEEYEIRDDTIIHRKGVLTTTEENYSLRSLGNASITQSIFGKIFNYGTIKLYSPLLKQDYFINNVHNPKQILSSLEDDLSEKQSKGTIIRRA